MHITATAKLDASWRADAKFDHTIQGMKLVCTLTQAICLLGFNVLIQRGIVETLLLHSIMATTSNDTERTKVGILDSPRHLKGLRSGGSNDQGQDLRTFLLLVEGKLGSEQKETQR